MDVPTDSRDDVADVSLLRPAFASFFPSTADVVLVETVALDESCLTGLDVALDFFILLENVRVAEEIGHNVALL
jgi:hypothetical protein